ncbi:hypothetical protein ACFQY5_38115 [Paeniroseomonas aquatica]|uniref:Uncharacterized protein n=1 Tax=Paeniroseomonas aquatica TaxID=373043 RepID=A0ABT8A2Z0_9PROT|nr:hypothetical protein [Paeniroseomonas aquatica]MDN3564127.1 hypothetical protein [Paeniroseomonas aquatica]
MIPLLILQTIYAPGLLPGPVLVAEPVTHETLLRSVDVSGRVTTP